MTLSPEELADVFFTAMEQVAAGQPRVTITDVLMSMYPEAIDELGNFSVHGHRLWSQVLDYEHQLHGHIDYSDNRFKRWQRCYETLKSKVR